MRSLLAVWLLCSSLFACGGGGGVVGRYDLDVERTVGMVPSIVAEEARKQLASVRVALLLENGGTFRGEMDDPQRGLAKIAGSWELAGEQIALRTTRQNDQPHDETMTGTLVDGVLTLDGGASGRISMVLRRR